MAEHKICNELLISNARQTR